MSRRLQLSELDDADLPSTVPAVHVGSRGSVSIGSSQLRTGGIPEQCNGLSIDDFTVSWKDDTGKSWTAQLTEIEELRNRVGAKAANGDSATRSTPLDSSIPAVPSSPSLSRTLQPSSPRESREPMVSMESRESRVQRPLREQISAIETSRPASPAHSQRSSRPAQTFTEAQAAMFFNLGPWPPTSSRADIVIEGAVSKGNERQINDGSTVNQTKDTLSEIVPGNNSVGPDSQMDGFVFVKGHKEESEDEAWDIV
ncbi:uncharacterized protein IL334_000541 [Kwoniella shivajii]|uniref:Uncharacterized protein n=1 Tax=Kwoniella shivajii TaxID=564305 RepID=A0ABZ1CPL4_9TREE|nr:hypothetical protein IL334_000541 [Kwoniella shivajii]